MTTYHIGFDGNPKVCKASVKPCPLLSSDPNAIHASSKEEAMRLFEEKQNGTLNSKNLSYERDKFFNGSPGDYTLIEVNTGTVFSPNSIVMESPVEDLEYFYNEPDEFIDDEDFNPQPLMSVRDLSSYNDPIIVELDTETICGADDIYAINTANEIVDFEAILDSQPEAHNAAVSKGFKIWD